MANRPLITTHALSEFGAVLEDPAFSDPSGRGRDLCYVPGFAEMRRDRDVAVGQYLRGEIPAAQVPKLPVNMRWARTQSLKGEPNNMKPFAHSRKGYRMVTKEDVGQAWFKEVPGGAQWAADGTLRNGDTTLMVCDQASAARNALEKQRTTENRLAGALGTFQEKLESTGGVVAGSDPQITKELSPATQPAKK